MNILLINSTMRKETTYNIANILISNLGKKNNVKELFLPKDMSHFCVGCGACFEIGEGKCPHNKEVSNIMNLLEWADLYIFAVPVYVYHVPGSLKTFLDHLGFIWMIHRPKPFMFKKQAVVISTAAGAGMKHAIKDVTHSLDFWGVGKVYTYKKVSRSLNWKGVSNKFIQSIHADMEKLSKKIIKNEKNKKTRLKVKLFFYVFRYLHRKHKIGKIDRDYWEYMNLLYSKKIFK